MATTVEIVRLTSPNGKHIRLTTKVTIDGRSVTFMEQLSKRAAIEQARVILADGINVGTRVLLDGRHEGTVTELLTGQLWGMANVRLDSGEVTVDLTALTQI